MGANQAAGQNSMEKLASGLRINRAGDDAAGLAISEKMRAQIRGLDQASRNSQDGISMIQTAEGALQETHNILQRMRELATQAANDTNVEVDRNEIQKEINQLTSEINRIANTTEFNTQKMLNVGQNTEISNVGGDHGNFSAVNFGGVSGLADGSHSIDVTFTEGVQAVDASSFTDEEISTGGTSSADVTLNGTYTGDADATLTVTFKEGVNGDGAQTDQTLADGDVSNGATALSFTRTGEVTEDATYRVRFTDTSDFTVEKFDGTDWVATGETGSAGGNFTIDGVEVDVAAAAGGSYTAGDTLQFDITADTEDRFDVTVGETTNTVLASDTDKTTTIDGVTVDVSAVVTANDAANNDEWTQSLTAAVEGQEAKYEATLTVDGGVAGESVVVSSDGGAVTLTGAGGASVTVDLGEFDFAAEGDQASKTITFDLETTGDAKFTADLQIGANTAQSFRVEIDDMRAQALSVSGAQGGEIELDIDGTQHVARFTTDNGVTDGTDSQGIEAALDVSSHDNATAAIKVINDAIEQVSAQRSELGAFQNRLEHTISNLNNSAENLQAAESRIRDVDMAREVMSMTKNNILAQASQSMLAQANQAPQAVLQLLG